MNKVLQSECLNLTPAELRESVDAKNRESSRNEVAAWLADKPQQYFAYVKERENTERMGCGSIPNLYIRGELTTWMGDKLGFVYGGIPYRDSFGAERVSIDVVGTNGVLYHGTYYRSSGNYCRIKAYKNQAKAIREKNYTMPTTEGKPCN